MAEHWTHHDAGVRESIAEAEERALAPIRALAAEWEADDQEHLNTYGQHLPGSVGRMAELLREALPPTP